MGGWEEKWGLELPQLPTEVEVEVEAELGNNILSEVHFWQYLQAGKILTVQYYLNISLAIFQRCAFWGFVFLFYDLHFTLIKKEVFCGHMIS